MEDDQPSQKKIRVDEMADLPIMDADMASIMGFNSFSKHVDSNQGSNIGGSESINRDQGRWNGTNAHHQGGGREDKGVRRNSGHGRGREGGGRGGGRGRGRGRGDKGPAKYGRHMSVDPWQDLQTDLGNKGIISVKEASSNLSHIR
jgi:hypothetical protein